MVASNCIPQFFWTCSLNPQVLGSCQYAFSYFCIPNIILCNGCIQHIYYMEASPTLVRSIFMWEGFCMQLLHKIWSHPFSPPLATPLLLTQNHRHISLSTIQKQDENCRHITIVPNDAKKSSVSHTVLTYSIPDLSNTEKEEDLTESIGVVLAKYLLKVKLENSSQL